MHAPSATLAARGANERRRLHYRLAALMKHELRMRAVILLNLGRDVHPIDVALVHCDKIGRDPSTLRISYNMFDPGSRSSGGSISYCESPEAFVEQAERLFELEVTELSMYYPMLEEQLPVFETIARDTLPQLRAVHNPAI